MTVEPLEHFLVASPDVLLLHHDFCRPGPWKWRSTPRDVAIFSLSSLCILQKQGKEGAFVRCSDVIVPQMLLWRMQTLNWDTVTDMSCCCVRLRSRCHVAELLLPAAPQCCMVTRNLPLPQHHPPPEDLLPVVSGHAYGPRDGLPRAPGQDRDGVGLRLGPGHPPASGHEQWDHVMKLTLDVLLTEQHSQRGVGRTAPCSRFWSTDSLGWYSCEQTDTNRLAEAGLIQPMETFMFLAASAFKIGAFLTETARTRYEILNLFIYLYDVNSHNKRGTIYLYVLYRKYYIWCEHIYLHTYIAMDTVL